MPLSFSRRIAGRGAFTAEDRAIVDQSANSYLAEVGVEERTGGLRWFVRLPEQFSSWKNFSSVVTRAVCDRDPKPVHAADVRPRLETAGESSRSNKCVEPYLYRQMFSGFRSHSGMTPVLKG